MEHNLAWVKGCKHEVHHHGAGLWGLHHLRQAHTWEKSMAGLGEGRRAEQVAG